MHKQILCFGSAVHIFFSFLMGFHGGRGNLGKEDEVEKQKTVQEWKDVWCSSRSLVQGRSRWVALYKSVGRQLRHLEERKYLYLYRNVLNSTQAPQGNY